MIVRWKSGLFCNLIGQLPFVAKFTFSFQSLISPTIILKGNKLSDMCRWTMANWWYCFKPFLGFGINIKYWHFFFFICIEVAQMFPLKIRTLQFCRELFGWQTPMFGGFGIALLRLMFIKYPLCIQQWQPKLIMWMLLLGTNAISLLHAHLLTSTMSISEATSMEYECVPPSENDKSEENLKITFMVFLRVMVMFGGCTIYVMAYWSVHASNLTVMKYLSNQAMKKRIKRNAMTLLGKFLNSLS